MKWKDLYHIDGLSYFDDSVDNDVDTELRQQVQKTLFNNLSRS